MKELRGAPFLIGEIGDRKKKFISLQVALLIVAAARDGESRVFVSPLRDDVDRACSVEIAELDEVRSFVDFDVIDHLRDKPVEVRVSLAVTMAHEVDGNAVDKHRHIRAVIRIEASKEDLIGFTAALVLGDEQTGNQSENITGRGGWSQLQILLPNSFFCCCRNRLFPPHVDFHGLR